MPCPKARKTVIVLAPYWARKQPMKFLNSVKIQATPANFLDWTSAKRDILYEGSSAVFLNFLFHATSGKHKKLSALALGIMICP